MARVRAQTSREHRCPARVLGQPCGKLLGIGWFGGALACRCPRCKRDVVLRGDDLPPPDDGTRRTWRCGGTRRGRGPDRVDGRPCGHALFRGALRGWVEVRCPKCRAMSRFEGEEAKPFPVVTDAA